MFIRSEKLFLRPAWREDAGELFALFNDRAIIINLARAPWPYGPVDACEFVGRSQGRMYPEFLVTLPSGGGAPIIGGVGLARFGGEVELGYWIARRYWNGGYATEAVRAVLQIAESLGHKHVVARHFVDNPASGRVLEKSGFHRTGDVAPLWSRSRRAFVDAVGYAFQPGPQVNGLLTKEQAPPQRAAA